MFYLILNTCETHEKIKLVASLAKNVLHSYCIVLRTSVLSVSVYRCATSPITSQTAVCCATSSTTTTPLSSLSTSSTSTPLSLRCGTQALGLKRRLVTTSLFKGIVANFCYYFYREHCPITSPGRVEVSQQLIMHTLWTTRQPRSVRLAEAFHIFLSSPNTQHIMNDGYHVEYLMESNHFIDRLIN